MIEESSQGSTIDIPDSNTGLMQPDEDMPTGTAVDTQPGEAITLRCASLEKSVEVIEVVLEFAWMLDPSPTFQELDEPQRSAHEAARVRLTHPAPPPLHPRTMAIMAAEPAQHAMNNFVNADSMPAQPEQQMPGFEPKMANPTVRQATGTQVRDECVGAILYWWDIATFFRCAIERDPSNCDIALVGAPHSTGNGITRD